MARKAVVPVAAKRPNGRPTSYSKEIAQRICDRIAAGESLIRICRDDDMPAEITVRGWDMDGRLADDKGKPWEGFSTRYAHARLMQIEHEVEEAKEIADTPMAGVITVVKTVQTKNGPVEITEVRHEDMIAHRKLQIDTRKWRASKIAWRNYGDRLGQSVDGEGGGEDPKLVVEGGLPEGEP